MVAQLSAPSVSDTAVALAPAPNPELGAQFEALARRLRAAVNDPAVPSCLVGVTSCTRGEGVSTVASNLAAYATHVVGSAVLLLEANLENASLAERLGTPATPGLMEALANPEQWNSSLHRSQVPNVWLMPAGRVSRQTRPMASLAGAERLLATIRNRFPFVVVDLPPAPESVFGLALAECLDGVLLVLEAERMRVQVVERAKQLFTQSRVNLLGAVLNKRRLHIPSWLYRRL